MTMKQGLVAARSAPAVLSDVSASFSSAAVFGARGNSGVIVSQFFKGLAEGFRDTREADAAKLFEALRSGVRFAYASVARPIEGTILTVLREATDVLGATLPLDSVDEAIAIFLAAARESLEKTPELLPVLKKAGVVDSGASGIVYFFDGIDRGIRGVPPEDPDTEESVPESRGIDLTLFNKDTRFEYGYCVEGLIQLNRDPSDFDYSEFKSRLYSRGESIVTTIEGDKVKLHIHTNRLAPVMELCQGYGELLTVKIENMTVQNIEKQAAEQRADKLLFDPEREIGAFATVAVATSVTMQKMLFDMGIDAVILSDVAPSAQDFTDAFAVLPAEEILVFPNSSNSILTSMQASSLYKKASVRVLNCRTTQECYAALSVLDFDADADDAVAQFNSIVSGLKEVFLYHAVKDADYDGVHIKKNEFFALSGDRITAIGRSLESVAVAAVKRLCKSKRASVLTLFYGKDIAEEYIEHLLSRIEEQSLDIEIASVSTEEAAYSLALILE